MKRTISTLCLNMLSLCILPFVLIIGCKKTEEPEVARQDIHSKKVIVRIDNAPIYEGAIIRRIKAGHRDIDTLTASPDKWQRIFKAATETEILDHLLLKEGLSKGINATQEEINDPLNRTKEMLGQAQFEQMLKDRGASEKEYRDFLEERLIIKKYRDRLFENITFDDERLEQYYEGHKESFKRPESIRLEVLTFEDFDGSGVISERVQSGEDMEKLAGEFSSDERKITYSKTRWIPYSGIPEDVRDLIKSGETGDIIKPAQVDTRIHIYKILEKRSEYIPPFEEVREELRNSFMRREQQKIIDDWYEAAKEKVTIEYIQ